MICMKHDAFVAFRLLARLEIGDRHVHTTNQAHTFFVHVHYLLGALKEEIGLILQPTSLPIH